MKFKKFIALLLCISMVLTITPINIFAQEDSYAEVVENFGVSSEPSEFTTNDDISDPVGVSTELSETENEADSSDEESCEYGKLDESEQSNEETENSDETDESTSTDTSENVDDTFSDDLDSENGIIEGNETVDKESIEYTTETNTPDGLPLKVDSTEESQLNGTEEEDIEDSADSSELLDTETKEAELMSNIVANGSCGDNLTWILDDEGTLTISGTGSMGSRPWSSMKSSIKNVVIEDGVTSICSDAFSSCNNLKSIEIADSVNYIGSYAFYWCNALEEIVIPVGVTSISYDTFYCCQSLTNIVIPETVTSIGSKAFYCCNSLAEIIIPNSVISIGSEAFLQSGLAEITVPGSVKTIGYEAFYNCDNLAKIVLSNGVESIGEKAFYSCDNLSDIIIHDSVTSISSNAFSGTAYYKDTSNWDNGVLYIGNCLIKADETLEGDYSVKTGTTLVAEYAFSDCSKVTSVELPSSIIAVGRNAFSGTAYYDNANNWHDGVLYIGNCLIKVDASLEGNYSIKSGTTLVADYAFYENYIDVLTVPDSVERIGHDAFGGINFIDYRGTEDQWGNIAVSDGNYSLEYATIMFNANEHATDKGKFLVEGNKIVAYFGNDETIVIPETIGDNVITEIGEWAFSGNEAIKKIVIGENITHIGSGAFSDCYNISEINIPSGITSIEECAFRGLAIENISIPEGVTVVKNEAFMGCTNLSEISLPSTLTEIWGAAFYGTAYEQNEDNYEDGVLYIGEYLIGVKEDYDYYEENEKMPAINVKEGTVLIADSAFGDYVSEVNIPSSLKYISFESFAGTNNLEGITVSDDNPYYSSADGVLYNKDKSVLIRFCSGSKTTTTFVVPATVKCINPYSFDYMWPAKTIIVSATVETIYLNSFNYWYTESLLIFDGTREELDDINYKYYYRWDKGPSDEELQEEIEMLKSAFSLKSNLYQTENGYIFFDGASIVKYGGTDSEIEIPASYKDVDITKIENYAFSNIYSLKNVVIPDSITSIAYGAFSDCINLENIVIGNGVTSIDSNIFYNCNSLANITVADTNKNYSSDAYGVLFDKNKTTLIKYPSGASNDSYTIPDGVVNIVNSAFDNCNNLTSLNIPDSITNIGNYAFYKCDNLTIYCSYGSYAQEYAESNNLKYASLVSGECGDGLTWTFNAANGVLTIEGYGEMSYSSRRWGTIEDDIKEVVVNSGVLNIASSAFYSCESLEKVIIHDGVTSIDYGAFNCCYNLTDIVMPDSITSIGSSAFSYCNKLTNVIMPKTISSIGSQAFYGCSALTNISIPDGLTTICYDTFRACKSLVNIEIPDSVTEIEDTAFDNCTSLENIIIGKGVASIGYGVFGWCDNLISISVDDENNYYSNDSYGALFDKSKTTFIKLPAKKTTTTYAMPDGVVIIGEDAFSACSNLISVTIPNSVTGIGSNAFYECINLTSIKLPEHLNYLGSGAFWGCSNLESIVIPSGVTELDWTLQYCTSLKEVTLPESLKTIGNALFRNCKKLKSVTIPQTVQSIGSEAFINCSDLTKVSFTNNVTEIKRNAFSGCNGLIHVYYDGTTEEWGSINIDKGNDNLLQATIYIDGQATYQDSPEEDFVFEDGVITDYTGNAYQVNIPKTIGGMPVTKIGNGAFSWSSKIKSVRIPEGVTEIDGFSVCENLESVVIPSTAVRINSAAFERCTSLKSITIPDSVKYIEESAFEDCTDLSDIIISCNLEYVGKDAFYNTAYFNNNSNWSEDVLYIDEYLIKAKDDISGTYFIKNGTKIICHSAFSSCKSLEQIVFPDSVKIIQNNAFEECYKIHDVILSQGVIEIGEKAFYAASLDSTNCAHGTSYIDTALITAGTNGEDFYCIREDVTIIASGAFSNCDNLTEIEIPINVKVISSYAINSCDNLHTIHYPGTEEEWNKIYISEQNDVLKNTNVVYESRINREIISGTCGANITWTLDDRGCLTISGAGKMHSYNHDFDPFVFYSYAPWYEEYRHLIKKVVIDDGITYIGNYAFYDCQNISCVEFGNTIETIGKKAFYWCRSLSSVVIPENIINIGESAFGGCFNLSDIVLENGIQGIGSYAFGGGDYSTIYIPSSVISIGSSPFGCDKLEKIIVSDSNLHYTNDDYGVLFNRDKTKIICAPNRMLCASYIIPDSVIEIGNSAFSDVLSLESIVLGENVSTIGGRAFSHCDNLQRITMSDNIKTVYDDAFNSCDKLKSVYINDVSKWCRIQFKNYFSNPLCNHGDLYIGGELVGDLIIPSGVASIGNFLGDKYYIFNCCNSIKTVSIPKSVKEIGPYAFNACDSITEVFYEGTKEEWERITIGENNSAIINAHKTFKSCFSFNTTDGYFYGKIGLSGLSSSSNYIFGEKNLSFASTTYTIEDIVFESSNTDIFEILGASNELSPDQYGLVISANKEGTATITAKLPDGTSISSGVVIEKSNKLELTKTYATQYLYSNKTFFSHDKDLSTTPELYIVLKNASEYSYDFSTDNGRSSLHNVKISATVSGGNMSFDKTSYRSTYQALIEELKINESLADLLLLYPYNVNDDTFATEKKFDVTLTITADELDTPYTETISFTVENYNSYIINSHLDFINNNDAYKVLKNNDAITYGNAVKDTWDYDWNNALFNLISIDNLLGFDNPYDIVVADVLSEFLGSEQYKKFGMSLLFKEFAENYESVLTTVWEAHSDFSDVAGDISGIVDTIVQDEYFNSDLTIKPNAIEKIFKASKYKTSGVDFADEDLFSYVSDKFGNSLTAQSKINNAFAACDKAGQVWKIANTGKKAINDINEGIYYTTVLNAYCEADKASKEAVGAVLGMMYLDNSSNSRLTSALEKYVSSETKFGEIASKIEIALETGAEVVYGLYDSLFSAQVESILWHHLGNISCTYLGAGTTLTAASAAGGFLAGWSAGKGISDFLCDGSDKAGEMKKVVILGDLAEYAEKALVYCENMLKENPTMQNVEYYERMLEFFKIIQTQTITHVQKVNESKAYSFIERVFTNRENEVVQINMELESSKKFYSDIRCHGWSGSDVTSILSPSISNVKVIQIKCPVNVYLYTLDDELLIQITDNKVVFAAEGVVASVIDETKYVIIPAEQQFKIEIIANSSGTMNYSVTEYNQGETVRKVNFNDVSLYEGQSFNGNLNAGYEVSEESYALSTTDEDNNQEVIYHSEVYSGSQIQTLSVSVTCEGDGEARGVSSAICGDYVIVVATPNDGIGFSGWYDSEGELLSREANYGFVIREDMELVAKFQSGVTGDLNGDDEVTDSDAIYLMYYTFFPEDYPINQDCDFDGDGEVTDNDAIYLMYYTFFPEEYPLSN